MYVCMYLFENLRYFLNNILSQKNKYKRRIYFGCFLAVWEVFRILFVQFFIKRVTNKCIINIELRLIQKLLKLLYNYCCEL